MAAGDLLGDGGPMIATMRNQELLRRTYGMGTGFKALEPDLGLDAKKWQLQVDKVVALPSGCQRFLAGQIITHIGPLTALRSAGAKLLPVK
jgi:hypothetical protein